MANDKTQAEKLLKQFNRKLMQSQLPDLKLTKSTTLTLTVPDLDSKNLDSQLLRSARLHFAPREDLNLTFSRSGDTVSLTLTKKF